MIDAPPVAGNDSYTVYENTGAVIPPAIGFLSNDFDSNAGDTFSVVFSSQPMNGSVTVNANGSFTYLPGDYFGADSSLTELQILMVF